MTIHASDNSDDTVFEPEGVTPEAESKGSGPKRSARPRRKKKRSKTGMFAAVRQLPSFVKLLYGLITDARVPASDKVILGAAIAYLVSPIDLVPDFLPVVGGLDDVLIVVFAIRRLIKHTEWEVLLDHWDGDERDLENLGVEQILAAGALFLPGRVRHRLRALRRW